MVQPCAGKHQSRVPIRERPCRASPATDLSVQPFSHIVGADARPRKYWKKLTQLASAQCSPALTWRTPRKTQMLITNLGAAQFPLSTPYTFRRDKFSISFRAESLRPFVMHIFCSSFWSSVSRWFHARFQNVKVWMTSTRLLSILVLRRADSLSQDA